MFNAVFKNETIMSSVLSVVVSVMIRELAV